MSKITVNLWDFNFRQSSCSTAYQEAEQVEYIRGLTEFDGITIFTDGYIFDGTPDRVQSRYKVAWLREPECLWPKHYVNMPEIASRFDLVLTYYCPLLELQNARYVPYGGVWIDRGDWGLYPHKPKFISMLYGEKRSTEGHRIRHEIGNATDGKYDIDFYGVRGEAVDYGPHTKLRVLKDYRFTIVTETCMQAGLFTEILLDCFAVGTVPIYWGDPAIATLFDPAGIIPFASVGELLHILDKLRPSTYERPDVTEAVWDNLGRVEQYVTAEDWMVNNGIFEGMV